MTSVVKTTIAEVEDNLAAHEFHAAMGIWEPGTDAGAFDAVVVVGIDADPEERPWDSLEASIKDGAKQLKGGPPRIIAIRYSDPVDDFEQLTPGPEPMRVQIERLLENLPDVGAVMLSTEPDLQLPGAGGAGHTRIYHGRDWLFPGDFPLGEPIGHEHGP